MESKSYLCSGCKKTVKSISGLTRYINVCKISITLPTCQPSNSKLILEYNVTNHLNFLLDNSKKDISQGVSHNSKEEIRHTNIDNNEKDNIPVDIDK